MIVEVIINATNIGKRLSGIGRYSLSLSHHLLKDWDYPFQLFINRHASSHFEKEKNKDKIKVINGIISPDFGFKGHLRRLLWTNTLCLNPKELIFNTSQLEGCLYHKKQILTIHDLIPLIYPQYHRKQYYYFKYVLPIIIKNTVRIITGSQNTKHLIMDCYKIPEEKISVINYGVSEIFLCQTPEFRKENFILYVGRLSPTKNIEGLMKAFEILINGYNLDLRLKLTGDERQLNFRIDEKIKNRIEFVGYPKDDSLAELYKNASLLVLPSFYEGFGLPPLEAMACGCPVAVSNVSSLPEVCGDAAYYVDPYSVENIAEGIYKVLMDEVLSQSLIEKGLKRTKLFSWDKSAKEHIQIFEETLIS